jgi:hypothetical protein
MQQGTVCPPLGRSLQEPCGAADPAHTLGLVAPREMGDAEDQRGPGSVDRSCVGKERIARGRVQAEVVFDTAEPPHGIGLRPEVVRGEQVGLNRIEM